MKSTKRLLAILLAVALLLLPAAMAEQSGGDMFFQPAAEEAVPVPTAADESAAGAPSGMVEAHRLTVSDPQVTVAGVPLIDLEGLSVEGTAADTGETLELMLRLLGGDDVAAEGYARFDGRQLVFGAEGLSNDYVLPLEKMLGGQGAFSPAFGMLAGLLSTDTLMALADSYLDMLEATADTMLSSRTELGAQTIDFATGPLEMQGYSYTVTPEDFAALTEAYLDELSSIPVFAALFQGAIGPAGAAPDAYNEEKGAASQASATPMEEVERALAELGDLTTTIWYAGDAQQPTALRSEISLGPNGEFSCNFVYDVYLLEDGNYAVQSEQAVRIEDEPALTMRMEGVSSVANAIPPILEGEAQAVADRLIDAYAGMFSNMMDVTFTMEMADTLSADGSFYIYPQGYNELSVDRSAFGMSMNIESADGENGFAYIEGYYSPADGINYDYDEFSLTANTGTPSDNGTLDVLLQTQHADGCEYYGAQVSVSSPSSGAQSLYFTYEGDYMQNALGTEDKAGHLSLGASVGYGGSSVDYTASADVSMTHAMVDASTLPAAKGTPVDMLMIDEKGMQQLSLEGSIIGMQIAGTLTRYVPGIIPLISGANINIF